MEVVSLFDGAAVGLHCLKELGIPVRKYYASEINPLSIKVAKENHPEIIHVGDVNDWQNWSVGWGNVQLILAGSPCQGFSRAGKEEHFKDSRSRLFFVFLDILEHIKKVNPKVCFLLENTLMSKKSGSVEIISRMLGQNPLVLNSSEFTPQHRLRNYWFNWEMDDIPLRDSMLVRDIMDASGNPLVMVEDLTLPQQLERVGGKGLLQFIPIENHSSPYGLVCVGGLKSDKSKMWLDDGKVLQRNFPQGNRVYSSNGKACTLTASGGGLGSKSGLYYDEGGKCIRKLTRVECERLQGLPEGYTSAVTDAQGIRILGDGWTAPVIEHLLKSCPALDRY